MESLFNIPLPFQRRLTKMYTDTKNSYDFVKEPVQRAEDPELLSLHRKLRIQKDRLVSWGLEWSDPSQSPDIDESINKAGLSELVGSIMSTIKEILAEAEPLWQSSKRLTDEKGSSGSDRKVPLIMWDKTRFQDLVRDLTMSIDTLYDLSRTRQSARKLPPLKTSDSASSSRGKSPASEERQFQSSRMQTPHQVDPKTLIWPRDLKTIPANMLVPTKSSRQIVLMRRPASYHDTRKHGTTSPIVPVLLEYAPYDQIYTMTGITPSMTRFEKLFAALSQNYISSERTLSGLLNLIGYFEEVEYSRFCLLYALPANFGPLEIESPKIPSITILSDLLYSQTYEPSLEIKYRLAYNVANAVFDLHAKGVVHGNVVSSNILFIEPPPQNRLDLSQVNLRQSTLASFDIFSDNATDNTDAAEAKADPASLYKHPLDPRVTRYTRLTSESKSLDLYSLAMLLLEIGLWTPLHDIFPAISAIPENTTEAFKLLGSRCGNLYVKAVQSCWHAPEEELAQKSRPDVLHQKVFWKVSKALYTCCAIDLNADEDSSDLDEPSLIPESPVISITPTPQQRNVFGDQKSPSVSNLTSIPSLLPAYPERSSPYSKPLPELPSFTEKMGWGESHTPVKVSSPAPKAAKIKPKLRTYPSVKIAPEYVDHWHNAMMPHINMILRNFYKKYPESVEISLESIGESSATAKPTILVICTSVDKVRSILKKSLAYDKSVFGLKVCRGKVIRSRKDWPRRSGANQGFDIKPQHAGHQERPCNGASIGAYVGDHHLPPVSFGGLVLIDDKPYGMTVHHMLDDPFEGEDEEPSAPTPILRSSAQYLDMPDLTHSESSVYSSGDEEFMYTLSDYESDFSSSGETTDEEDDIEDSDSAWDDENMEPGDIKGIPQGCGESYLITQPAIDDIPSDFYPDEETRDEDHLDSFQLGEVYASSGIKRRTENEIVHEIDWALFEFSEDRCPETNLIENGSRYCLCKEGTYPLSVARTKELGGLDVHCIARTSGLQTGRILPAMVIVKIYGRQTPSMSYQVAGKLGVPGDSGAWVVDNEEGKACGHVLAWSTRKKVAYICPMEVLLKDIAETLDAKRICLPGGDDLLDEIEVGDQEWRNVENKNRAFREEDVADLLRGLDLNSASAGLEAGGEGGGLEKSLDELTVKGGPGVSVTEGGEGIKMGRLSGKNVEVKRRPVPVSEGSGKEKEMQKGLGRMSVRGRTVF